MRRFSITKHEYGLLSAIALFVIALVLNKSFQYSLVLFVISYLLAGGEILLKAIKQVSLRKLFNENVLMSIATIAAFAIGEYPEAVAVMLFFRIGEFFEDLAVDRAKDSIADLMNIKPEYANVKRDSNIIQVSPENVIKGELIVVKPGERVPLDSIILEGNSSVDTSALTGESMPRDVFPGDKILSGYINISGVMELEVINEYQESAVARILNLVENASAKKALTEQFITRFARYYTPVVVLTALLIAMLPPLIISGATFSEWVYRACVMLVISCPCALTLSIPLTYFGGIGGASRRGVLVKGGNYLDALNQVDAVIFDKTGTLTEGVFEVTEIVPVETVSKDYLLSMAAHAEFFSNQPLAKSIISFYHQQLPHAKIEQQDITEYQEIPGFGVQAYVQGIQVILGNHRLMKRSGFEVPEVEKPGSVVYIAIDNSYVGYIVLADKIKEDATATVQALREKGILHLVMLTGDRKIVGQTVGEKLGLDDVYAELLPEEKVEIFDHLKKKGLKKVAFVGDGMNDAPVLAKADIGVAMGGLGSDAAIEAADIVLTTDEPGKLVEAMDVAKRTKRIVVQNIVLALGVKVLFLTLGAFGVATLWEAVFADVGVTILAVLNASRVLRVRKKQEAPISYQLELPAQ